MAALFFLLGTFSGLAGALVYHHILPTANPDPTVFLELFRTLYGDRNEPTETVDVAVERALIQREIAQLEERAAMVPSARGEFWADPTEQFQPDQHTDGAVIPPGMTWQGMNGMGEVGDGLGLP